jgi:5'-nucleotidase
MENIIIPDKKRLEQIKNEISRGGKDRFHVLADFDRTLTKAFYKGKKASSIISQLRNGKYLTEEYAAKAHALFDKYHPIEIDPNIPLKEKTQKMQEWWEGHMNLLIESGFDLPTIKKCISDLILEDNLNFRDGAYEFFQLLEKNNIPLIIMSSSLGNLISEFMEQKGVLTKNVHVIGNVFIFNSEGKATGNEKIIHVFNKHEIELKNLNVYDELINKKNVLLLGDSIGDLGMVEGFSYENLIKIGYLNEEVEGNLEEYKKNFDAVLLGDSDMNYINNLLKEMFD